MPERGKTYLLYVDTAQKTDPEDAGVNWVKVAGQRDLTEEITADTIDTTNKCDGAWKTKIYGDLEWSLDLDEIIEQSDGGFQELRDAMKNQRKILVQTRSPNGTTEEGLALVTSFSRNMPNDDVATASISLEGDGALTEKAGP